MLNCQGMIKYRSNGLYRRVVEMNQVYLNIFNSYFKNPLYVGFVSLMLEVYQLAKRLASVSNRLPLVIRSHPFFSFGHFGKKGLERQCRANISPCF